MKPIIWKNNPNFPRPTMNDSISPIWAKQNENEILFNKSTYNAFYHTDLETYLLKHKIDTIYICGMLTSICVHKTAVGGISCGFNTIIIDDCCIDRSLDRHNMTLQLYKDYIYTTVSLHEIVDMCSSNSNNNNSSCVCDCDIDTDTTTTGTTITK